MLLCLQKFNKCTPGVFTSLEDYKIKNSKINDVCLMKKLLRRLITINSIKTKIQHSSVLNPIKTYSYCIMVLQVEVMYIVILTFYYHIVHSENCAKLLQLAFKLQTIVMSKYKKILFR